MVSKFRKRCSLSGTEVNTGHLPLALSLCVPGTPWHICAHQVTQVLIERASRLDWHTLACLFPDWVIAVVLVSLITI